MRKFYVTYILGCTCQDKVIHDKEVWLGSDETACSEVFKRYLFGNPNANHTIISWSLIEEVNMKNFIKRLSDGGLAEDTYAFMVRALDENVDKEKMVNKQIMTVDEVYKNLSEAKIPIRWKTSIHNAYRSGWKNVVLFAPQNWYNRYGERALTSLYRYTGFKNDITALSSETYVGMEIYGYKITIYLE